MSQSQCGRSPSQVGYRIVALVGRYPANQLMRHKSILYQCFEALLIRSPCSVRTYAVLAIVSNSYPPV